MNLKPKNSVQRFLDTLHFKGKNHIRKRPYILPVFGLVLGVIIVAGAVVARGGETKSTANSYVVFLYDKGEKQTLDSRSATVGELVEKLPLNLQPEDVVEPSLDTPIVEDNFRVNVYRARPVTVVDTDSRKVTLTAQQSPRIVAENAGLKVFPEDKISFAAGDINKNILGEQVVVDRATPVILNLYGESLTLRTHASTVGELLAEKKIFLDKNDKVQPKPSTKIKSKMQIFVIRSGTRLKTVTEVVPAPVESVSDQRLTYGTTALRQEGAPGKQVVTYEIQIKNGQEVGRKVIQRVVVVSPVPRIIAVGSQPFSGSLQTWLLKLRQCESGGNYQSNTGNGFYGAYQFLTSTWATLNTGYARADLAPPAVQDQGIIRNTLRSSGGLASQNPGCYRSTGISAFPPSNR